MSLWDYCYDRQCCLCRSEGFHRSTRHSWFTRSRTTDWVHAGKTQSDDVRSTVSSRQHAALGRLQSLVSGGQWTSSQSGSWSVSSRKLFLLYLSL